MKRHISKCAKRMTINHLVKKMLRRFIYLNKMYVHYPLAGEYIRSAPSPVGQELDLGILDVILPI